MPIHPRAVSGVDRRQLIAGAALAMALPSVPRAFARATQEPATDVDTLLMRLAIEEGAQGDYPFGAVITRDGEVLARGHNLGIKEQNPTAHVVGVGIRRRRLRERVGILVER